MEIIKHLKSYIDRQVALKDLFEHYAIKSVQSKKYPELYLFKYTIKTPMQYQIC